MLFSPNQDQSPSSPPHTRTHPRTRRWASLALLSAFLIPLSLPFFQLSICPVPQGLGLDLTKGYSESGQSGRVLAFPAEGRKEAINILYSFGDSGLKGMGPGLRNTPGPRQPAAAPG